VGTTRRGRASRTAGCISAGSGAHSPLCPLPAGFAGGIEGQLAAGPLRDVAQVGRSRVLRWPISTSALGLFAAPGRKSRKFWTWGVALPELLGPTIGLAAPIRLDPPGV